MAYHLISIGISNYANPQNNLDYPDNDAGELSAILRHSLGAELTHDVLLRSNEASQISIRNALNASELKQADRSDTDTQKALAPLLRAKPEDIPQTFADVVEGLNTKSNGHWWHTLNPELFTGSKSAARE